MQQSDTRQFLTFTFFLAAVVAIFYWPFLIGSASFSWADHVLFFQPIISYVKERVLSGALPLWNPFAGCGQSQLALVSPGMFYPPHLLFLLLPYSPAVSVLMIFHQSLAGAGAFALVRRWRWGAMPALLAGAVVALNGYMFSLSQNFTLVETAAWLPLAAYWVLSAYDSFQADGKQRTLCMVAAAACVGLMVAAARPEIWCPALVFLITLPVAKALTRPRAANAPTVAVPQQGVRAAGALSAVAAGVLVSMPALLPALEWAPLSPRSALEKYQTMLWSSAWYDFLGLLIPPVWRADAHGGASLVALGQSFPGAEPLIWSCFVGPVVMTLAAIGFADRQWRWRAPCGAALVGVVVLAAGHNLPIMPWLLDTVKILSVVRYPVKLMFFCILLLAIALARGAHAVLRGDQSVRRQLKVIACLWGLLTIVTAGMRAFPEQTWFGLYDFARLYVGAFATEAIATIGQACSISSFAGLITCAVLLWLCRAACDLAPKLPVVPTAILTAGLIGSLMFVDWRYLRMTGEPGFYDHPSFIADALHHLNASPGNQAPRAVHLFPEPLLVPATYHAAGKGFDSNAAMLYRVQLCLPNTNIDHHVTSLLAYEGAMTKPMWVLLQSLLNVSTLKQKARATSAFPPVQQILSRICRLSATQYVVTQIVFNDGTPVQELNPALFQLASTVPFLNARIYATKQCLPFAYFLDNWQCVTSGDESLRLLLALPPDRLDPAHVVLISGDCPPAPQTQPVPAAPIALTTERPVPELIRTSVDAPKPGFVVVNDSFYPGWQATVDGRPAPVVCANGIFKAVSVSSGRHVIEMTFHPAVLGRSFLLSAAGLALLLCSLLLAQVRPARPHD